MTSPNDPIDETAAAWARLTEKQRDCLDLLLKHKTSKEMARILDISKDTVDQRLKAARDTLRTRNRGETAVLYGQLKSLYDQIVYDTAEVPPLPHLVRSHFPDRNPPNLIDLDAGTAMPDVRSRTGSLFRDLWRHDHGTAWRIMIYAGFLIGTVLILLGGLGIILFGGLGIAQVLDRLLAA